jgi:hypothetical protein
MARELARKQIECLPWDTVGVSVFRNVCARLATRFMSPLTADKVLCWVLETCDYEEICKNALSGRIDRDPLVPFCIAVSTTPESRIRAVFATAMHTFILSQAARYLGATQRSHADDFIGQREKDLRAAFCSPRSIPSEVLRLAMSQ